MFKDKKYIMSLNYMYYVIMIVSFFERLPVLCQSVEVFYFSAYPIPEQKTSIQESTSILEQQGEPSDDVCIIIFA